MKKPIASIYSMSTLVEFEPYVDTTIEFFLKCLEVQSHIPEPCDLGKWLQWFAFDVMGEITFSKRLGFLDKAEDVDGVIAQIFCMFRYTAWAGQIPWVDRLWAKNTWIRALRPEETTPIVSFALARARERTSIGTEKAVLSEYNSKDFMSRFLDIKRKDPSIPDWFVTAWTTSNKRWLTGDETQHRKMHKCLLTTFRYIVRVANAGVIANQQFGGGSRTCLGKNISYLEIYKLIPTLISKFEAEKAPDIEIQCRAGPAGPGRPVATGHSLAAPVSAAERPLSAHESNSTSPTQTRSSSPIRRSIILKSFHMNAPIGNRSLPENQDGTKARMVGITHWMAPCSEMLVVSAMLSGSDGFQANRQAFTELKNLVTEANEILPRLMPGFSTKGCPRTLLPDRPNCNVWIAQYCQTWGRIYPILDPVVLVEDLDEIFPLGPEGIVEDSLPLLRIFLVVSIGMQNSETNRLVGRRLARYVEDCIHSSTQFRKPCIAVMQLLLLLTVMKTISASETDDMSNMLGVQSFTSQIVLVMNLHRDPAVFPNLSPYEIEMRKRLWACFLRLSLDYCIRNGTQFVLFVDEIDCPPPSSTGLRAFRQSPAAPIPEQWETYSQCHLDAKFNFFAAKLARSIMLLQQALCSNGPSHLAGLQADLRQAFDEFLEELPLELKPGSPTSCVVQRLQQTLISTTLHSFALFPGMSAIIDQPYDVSLQGQLIEIWDHSISILDQFQKLCQETDDKKNPNIQAMAHQLLWADVARAALCSCLAVGKMHRRSLANLISSPTQQTAGIFEQVLNQSLCFLVQFWKSRFYLGPVTTKLALLLAVAMAVTVNLRDVTQSKGGGNDDALRTMGVAVAEEWVYGMRQAITQQQQGQSLTKSNMITAGVIRTTVGSTGSRSTGSPGVNAPTKEEIVPREINVPSKDVPVVAGPTVDERLQHVAPPTSIHPHNLSAGDTFDMVELTTTDPKTASELSHFRDFEFAASFTVDEQLLHIVPLTSQYLDSPAGDTSDRVDFTAVDPKSTPEASYFDDLELDSDGVQESIREILSL
ncbi:hypothetical protein VMCG_10687 [Cytospora schulzeri]|uniref:Xylanolytic transcriptional activator regulatory domain-containing protein n=1 Tax=Cytospora schulzeri TaxID=448051 RepID=A0A423V9I7_9PEZI|nr:hypothetical protein VMCG_10687 [Valsa malicola]